jgi:chromosomal replication initiation ATPase DnaA
MGCVEFTPEQIERAHLEIVAKLPTPRQSARELAARIAEDHGLTIENMLGPGRFKHLAEARADLYRALRAPPYSWSYPAIGRLVNRDHTTIIAAVSPKPKSEAAKLRAKIARCTR